MKPSPRLIYPLLASLGLLSFGCQKENQTYPTVEIREPENGASYAYGDTIRVEAVIKKRNGIASVSILKGNSVMDFGQEKVFDNTGRVHFELYYNNRYLNGGDYDLKVTAYNGENVGSDFREIHIQDLPKERLGVVAIGTTGGETVLTQYDEEDGIFSLPLNGDHSAVAYNGYQGALAVAPEKEGNLKAYNLQLVEQYEVPNPNLEGLRQYNDVESHGELIFSYENEGYIRARGADAGVKYNYKLPSQWRPLMAEFGEPGMLVCAKEPGKELYHLLVLREDNGAILKQQNLSAKAVDMIYAGNEKYVVTMLNEAGTGTLLMVYNTANNTLTKFDELDGEFPQSLVATENGEALLSTNGGIYRFNVDLPLLPAELYTFAAVDMEYDDLSGRVYYATGSSVRSAVPGNAPQHVFGAGHPIKEIEIIYNK